MVQTWMPPKCAHRKSRRLPHELRVESPLDEGDKLGEKRIDITAIRTSLESLTRVGLLTDERYMSQLPLRRRH